MGIKIGAISLAQFVSGTAEIDLHLPGQHENDLLTAMIETPVVLKIERWSHDEGFHGLKLLARGKHLVVVARAAAAPHEGTASVASNDRDGVVVLRFSQQ